MLLLHLSCSRDERRRDEPGVSEPNQARVTITLEVNNDSPVHSRAVETPPGEAADTIQGVAASYAVGDFVGEPESVVTTDSLGTRSTPATVEESAINDLWAIQFDENHKLVGKPVYQQGLRGKPEVTLMLTQTPEGKQHTVYFVTNTARADLFTENNVPTLERYRALLHSYANEAGVVAAGGVLMTGHYTGVLIDKGTIAQPIALTRAVAKITFNYRTANFVDGTIRILGVQLKNAAQHTAYLVPTAVPYPAIGSHADYAPETAPGETEGSYLWYLPENVRGTNPAIGWEGNKSKKNAPAGQGDYATLIEVRAEVTASDGATSNISYQFFVGQDMTDYSVERNRHYRLSIDFRGIDESDQRVVAGNTTPWLAATVRIADVMGTSATVRGTLLSDGGSTITGKGFYVSTDKNEIGTARAYLGAGLYAVEGLTLPFTRAAFVKEEFEQTLTGLALTTTYYVRPFATNQYGTTVGEQATFTTTGTPTIVTKQVSEVKATTAKVSYQITNNGASGITDRGVMYSKQLDFAPTAGSGVVKVSSGSDTELTLGMGSGGNLPLTERTIYYVRAYATNSEGTSYGKQLSFTTLATPKFQPVKITWVKGLYVQATVDVISTPLFERGVAWSEAAISTPGQGALKAGNPSGVVKESTSSNTWYLYPYAIMAQGESPYYGEVQYNQDMMPATSSQTTNVDKATGDITLEVAAQTGAVTSRGYCYSASANFDPVAGVLKDAVIAETSKHTATITYGTLPDGTYYIRTYAVNATGKSYSVAGEFEVKKAIPPEIQIGNTIWAPGNLYYDTATGEYKNASTQEYVHNAGIADGGAYFGWNTIEWTTGSFNNEPGDSYELNSDPCTLVHPAGTWVTPSKAQFEGLAPFKAPAFNEILKGYEFTDPNIKVRLFLPVTGNRGPTGSMVSVGTSGYYWSCTYQDVLTGDRKARYLVFRTEFYSVSNDKRSLGCSVRCVKKVP